MRISDWSSDVCSSDLEIQPLILAEKAFGDAERLFFADQHADVGFQRHFGEGHRDAAVRHIVAGGDPAGVDGMADEVAGALFGAREIGRASCREMVCPYV